MSLSRRHFGMLVGASFLTACMSKAKLPPSDYDCIIIGAGAAGISAARHLAQKGKSVRLVEARDRIGGRAWTIEAPWGAPFDMGCAWLEHFNRNPLRREARKEGLDLIESSTADAWIYRDGARAPDADLERFAAAEARIIARVEIAARAGEDGALSDYADAGDVWEQRVLMAFSSATIGTDPDRVSALDLAQLRGDGQRLVPGGLGAFVAGLADGLDIRLGAPVRKITASGQEVMIETAAGTLKSRTVLVTVPVSILTSGAIQFEPGLPETMRSSFEAMRLGTFEKVAFQLRRRPGILEEFAVGGALMDDNRPHVTHIHPEEPLATVLYGASWADEIRAGGDAAITAFAKSALSDAFGSDFLDEVLGAPVLTAWRDDPYALGSYAAVAPGRAAARDAYSRAIDDRIYFAGEADATGQSATVGGAWLSGQRAAKEIAKVV